MPVETVNTVVVQDREYGTDGQPLVNQEVTIRFAPAVVMLIAAGAAGNADQVALQPIEVRTKTDSTGFWSAKLVANTVITPANTYYSVKVGLIKTYDIAIPTGAGPFIAQNILTGALPLFPGGSSVAGPITITGNLAVTGTGTFSGALAANAGLAVLGGGNVSGGWTIAGLLTMSDAASRLVPGATSFSLRNNANTADNLIVTDAGNVTIRGTLTPLGDLLPAARIVMGPAAAKIVGGATSLSLRNNADNADNLLIADGGAVTARGSIAAQSLTASGVGQFTAAGRFLGFLSISGPPQSGTYVTSDCGFDSKGALWYCSVGGTPGTWLYVGGGPYHAEVYLAAAQSIPNNTATLISWDTILADPNGNFTTGVAAKYTCPLAGRYLVTTSISYSSAISGSVFTSVAKNAVELTRLAEVAANAKNLGGSAVVRTIAGDTLSVATLQVSGAAATLNGGFIGDRAEFTYLGP